MWRLAQSVRVTRARESTSEKMMQYSAEAAGSAVMADVCDLESETKIGSSDGHTCGKGVQAQDKDTGR